MTPEFIAQNRRRFLKFLAASPLATLPASAWQNQLVPFEMKDAKDAINVNDFEDMARRLLPPAHWGYMASGVDDDRTYRANIDGYKKIELRTRRLVDVSKPDLKVDLFGKTYDTPIFICPTGGHKMFHPEGEVATGRAAKSKNALQILSTVSSTSIEDVTQARGEPVWYQLYVPSKWENVETLVRRVEATGCPVMAVTVDLLAGRNTETFRRFRRQDTRDCTVCHGPGEPGTNLAERPMFKGLDMKGFGMNPASLDWAFVDKLRKFTKMKIVLKGIEAPEDAKLAVEHGVDGVLVSNHGGRAMETGRATIEDLPEVVDAVNGRIPVFVDGGIRRGSDALKALALGAKAVGIGRPYLWALTSFGQAGVERALDILTAELRLAMRQCGMPTLARINKSAVILHDSRS
ncbi:MAG TPA: alpha-hydroxy acid oxidase [Bryobacteraceae bacterium]|nr:alpha-hydroxy acid oxidase [Bryobacteraceae bacterium]